MRQLSPIDVFLGHVEKGLKAVYGKQQGSDRAHPSNTMDDTLDDQARKHSAGLMRVNHAGEIAAQGLYNGQSLFARTPEVRERMAHSAAEETDHLAWCKGRVEELGETTSLLGPIWYGGSFAIGALASLAGDKWSLGFVKETEDQVVSHLNSHLEELPDNDRRSREIVSQMITDEMRHGDAAMELGGAALPGAIRQVMQVTAKVMTATAYRI